MEKFITGIDNDDLVGGAFTTDFAAGVILDMHCWTASDMEVTFGTGGGLEEIVDDEPLGIVMRGRGGNEGIEGEADREVEGPA